MSFESFGHELSITDIQSLFARGDIKEGGRQAIMLLERLQSIPSEVHDAAGQAKEIDAKLWMKEHEKIVDIIATLKQLLAQYPD